MLFSEIIDQILIRSGQFFFVLDNPDPLACLGFSREQLWKTLGKRYLAYYGRYRPLTFEFNRTASPTGTLGQSFVLFGTDSAGVNFGISDANDVWDKNVGIYNRDPGMVPQFISKVQPTVTLSSAGIFYLLQITSFINTGEYSRLREPRTYIPKYERDNDRGILYVTEIGRLSVTAHYDFPYTEITDSVGKILDVDIKYLEYRRDELYFDMITGIFMQSVGRSRRAFLLDGNPIVIDADALVQEGKELFEAAKIRLEETSLWYHAIGQ
jgi:hypothetical protein